SWSRGRLLRLRREGAGTHGGLIAGLIATLGYNFFVVGTIGTSGFFMQSIIAGLTGFDLHWYLWGLVSIVVCFLMARTGVDFSSKVLGVALVLEVLMLVVFDVSVLVQTGVRPRRLLPRGRLLGLAADRPPARG
ncbi:hypothetical protein HR12_48690, partial [Microbacterium sp. SUBG005]